MTYNNIKKQVIDEVCEEDLLEIKDWVQRNDFLPEEDKKGKRYILRKEKGGKPLGVISWYPAKQFENIHDIKFGDVTSAVYIYEFGMNPEYANEQNVIRFLVKVLKELEEKGMVFVYFKENFEILKNILKCNRGAIWDEGAGTFMVGEVKYILKSLYKNNDLD